MSVKEFKKDEIIFKQGDFSPVMYDILAGQVGIFAAYGTENEKQIAVLGEGQVLGEMGLIDAYPRSATAVAMEDGVKLREIGEKEFSAYFSEQPERVLLIMRQLSARLRDTTADYQKALDTLNEMKGTKGTPDKRSKSLRDRIKEFFDLYAEAMAMNTLDRCDGLNPNDPFFFID